MKSQMKLVNGLACSLALALVPLAAARADVDVPAKIEQLKTNLDNGRANLEQYRENAKIVDANQKENAKAIKSLAKLRESLTRDAAETKAGRGGIEGAKRQVEGFMKTELEKIAAEKKQIEALQRTLAQLEENKRRREGNVASYREKLRSIDADAAAWSQRGQAIAEADRALREKEQAAAADKKRLAEKRASYAAEADKWEQNVRVADRQYANFSKLKEE